MSNTPDATRVQAFAGQMMAVLNHGLLGIMISIGHRTGLFDRMATLGPSTVAQLADATGMNERYLREWLASLVCGRIVDYDGRRATYHLPPEHAACLTRAAGPHNLAVFTQGIAEYGAVESDIIACFRKGGGVPYEAYGHFHDFAAEMSGPVQDAVLVDHVLPMLGVVDRLDPGGDVLDVGCGKGHALHLMARAFPASRFHGIDLCEETVVAARAEAERLGLRNVRFERADAAKLASPGAYDSVTAFDTIHDQADPAGVLARIRASLRGGGTFLCVDLAASSSLADNLEHPIGAALYAVSTMHCLTVSLAQGGAGLGHDVGPGARAPDARRGGLRRGRRQARRGRHDEQLLRRAVTARARGGASVPTPERVSCVPMGESHVPSGTRIADRYVVLGELGAGGMGVVVRARDERLGRDVAVKVLPASAVGDEQARRRIVREARAAAGLEHAFIVHVYDVGETPDGGAFLVMELVKGKSLREHLAAGSLPPDRALAAIVEVGRALAFAHEQGFVHRDVKPDNILVRDDGRAVVLDFGLAKAQAADVSVDAATVTAKGTFVGTPAYMPPEQARGEEVDARGDQFALAVTAFEVLSGRLPWEGRSALEIISEILRAPAKRLRDVRPELPAALDEAIARALEKKPGDRFATTQDFVAALQAAAPAAAPSGPRVDVVLAHAPTVAASVEASVASAVQARPRRSRWPLALLAVLALVGAGVVVSLRGSRDVAPAADAAPLAPLAPLARDGAVLACPSLVATAHDFAHAEWIGAAAAHLACERAALGLGGPSRTLVPAELLGVPRVPGDDFPADAFVAGDARDRMIHAASAADAWLDGTVERAPDAFHVVLILRAKGGAEVARGEGAAMTLPRAVRGAMVPLFDSKALPRLEGSPWLRDWHGGASVDAALALHDLHVAILDENPEAAREECASVRQRVDAGPAMARLGAALCADRLGEPMPPKPPLDTSSPGALATSAATLRLYTAKTDEDRAQLLAAARALEEAAAKEPVADARALLAAVAAEVHYARAQGDEARRLSLISVQASPKEVDVRGTAWHRLAFTSIDNRIAVLAPHMAWVAWEPFPHSNMGHARGDLASIREGAHRAAVLAGQGYWVVAYGEALIETGDVNRAAAVAAIAGSASLTVQVMRAEGRLRAALDAAVEAITRVPARPDASTDAVRLAVQAAELSSILERPPAYVQDFFDWFIAPEPSPLSNGVIPFFSALSVCLMTPKPLGARCVARLGELFRAGHFGAAYIGASDALAGAERYMASDWAGAAMAWRATITRTSFGAAIVRTPMADLFDRVGEPDVADRVDAGALGDAALPSLALARAAARAEKRGDCATARRHAQRLVDTWGTSDERPPAVERMKKLLLRCAR